MKIVSTQRDMLLAPLQVVGNIVERRSQMPILSNVYIGKDAKTLSFISSDLEMQITTTADIGAGKEASATTVQGRKLVEILRSLPESSEVDLSMTDKRVTVQSGKSRFCLQTVAATEFPMMAEGAGEEVCAELPQKTLRHLIELVQFAMAVQDIRYYLNGMLLILEGNTVTAVATDGHRLACARTEVEASFDRIEAIVPRKAVTELQRQLEAVDAPVNMGFSAGRLRCEFGRTELVTKLVEGKFPDFTRVLPSNYELGFEVDRLLWHQALQRAALLCSDKFRGVKCVFSAEGMRITCTNADLEEAVIELDLQYEGPAIELGLNVNYLLEVLANLKCEKVSVKMRDSASSILITLPEDDSFRYVVMPMKI